MPRISAAEAEEIVKADLQQQRRMNQANLPVMPRLMKDLTSNGVFHVCNVGPWAYHVERGPIYLDIPAYKAEADPKKLGCAMSAPMPAVRQESKIIGGGGEMSLEYGFIYDDGRRVALDLIGKGAGMAAHACLIQYGVFVPEESLPTKEEIREAVGQLNSYAERLIQEAREAFDKGREEWNRTKSDRHLWAGRLMGIQEKWVSEDRNEAAIRCEMCGKHNPTGIAKCSCGYILDMDLFAKLEKQQAEIRALVKA